MKRERFFKLLIPAVLIFVLAGSIAVFSEPGGTDDPVVTKSYIVDTVIPEIKDYVNQRIGNGGTSTDAKPATFTVVNLTEGQSLIGDAGTELILRMGKGVVISTEKGGIADTTAGYDIANGSPMPSNHLLIVPLADGRGFKAQSDVIVMVKGGYTVK